MRIPKEQTIPHSGGGSKTIDVNPDYQFTQVTVTGRNTGIVTPFARPLLTDNEPENYQDDDFEAISDSAINLADNPRKRTFTIEHKRITAIKLNDAGTGALTFLIRQWGFVG